MKKLLFGALAVSFAFALSVGINESQAQDAGFEEAKKGGECKKTIMPDNTKSWWCNPVNQVKNGCSSASDCVD